MKKWLKATQKSQRRLKQRSVFYLLNQILRIIIPHSAMHHATNHVRFMISPELHVVQDRVHGSLEPTWFRAQSAFRITLVPLSPHLDIYRVPASPYHPISRSPHHSLTFLFS